MSGHVEGFHDPLVDCRFCKRRYRADHLDQLECGAKPSSIRARPSSATSPTRASSTFHVPTRIGALIYEVSLYDQAGNLAATAVGLKPGAGIFSPIEGEVVKRPPVANWAKVPKARFYNVQLWRGNVKLLTTWPRSPKLALPTSWTFSGKKQRLRPGRYRLFVWPAYGTPKQPRYGKPVGQVSFVVRR